MPTYEVGLEWTGCRAYETRRVEAESEEALEQNPYLACEGELIDNHIEYAGAGPGIIQITRVECEHKRLVVTTLDRVDSLYEYCATGYEYSDQSGESYIWEVKEIRCADCGKDLTNDAEVRKLARL